MIKIWCGQIRDETEFINVKVPQLFNYLNNFWKTLEMALEICGI